MILGLERHWHAHCFQEVDDAVKQLTDRLVVFNAHSTDVHGLQPPKGAILYSLENLSVVPQWRLREEDHEIWDYNKANLPFYPNGTNVFHVPVGYHPSMERFERKTVLDIDFAFAGGMNERRVQFFNEIRNRGFSVEIIRAWGAERDAILSRARLVINLHHNTNPGLFESVRVSHLLANKVPVLTEESTYRDEQAWGLYGVPYNALADLVENQLKRPQAELEREANILYERFKQLPMTVPTPRTTGQGEQKQ